MKIFKVKPKVVVFFILFIAEIIAVTSITYLRGDLWAAIQNKQLTAFITFTLIFTVIAIVICISNGLQAYIISMVSLVWRTKLTKKALNNTISHGHIEGFNQRVQDDAWNYANLKLMLWQKYLYAVVMSIVYIYIVVTNVSVLFLIFPIVYAGIGTLLGYFLAKPLTNLNYKNQVVETNFRLTLSKLVYGQVYRNNYNVFAWTKYVSYFQGFYNQIAVIFPYIALAPLYFNNKLPFPVLMMLAPVMAQLVETFGAVVQNFGINNKLYSCVKRLREIEVVK